MDRLTQHLPLQDEMSGDGGDGSGGPGDGSGEGDGADHLAISGDQMIQFEGMDAPVRASDYLKSVGSLSDIQARETQFETSRKQAEQLILDHAKRLDARGQPAKGQPTGQPAKSAQEVLQAIRERRFVSGNDVASLAELVQTQGVGPLQAHAQQVNELLGQLAEMVQSQGTQLGTLTGERQAGVTDTLLGSTITESGLDKGNETLMEFARDVYHSFVPGDGQGQEAVDAEFPTIFAKRVEGLRKYFREQDRSDAEAARTRRIPKRGGGASPTGDQDRPFETPGDIWDLHNGPAEVVG